MKNTLQILIYGSVIFLLVYLFKTDNLSIPEIKNYRSFGFSIIFLILGFLLQAITWKIILKNFNIGISFKLSIISDSLCVFMKYIPGKVMSILGRASYISNTQNISLLMTSSASFFSQMLALWTGLILGIAILLSGMLPPFVNISSAISIILLTAILIYPDILLKIIMLITRALNKEIKIQSISMGSLLGIMPYFFSMWLFWGIGFYFFSVAITQYDVDKYIMLAFPFATSLAIIAFIAPGGIGIREGTLLGFLLLLSLPLSEATTIAISSRLWFLFGEVIYFVTGLTLKNFMKT